MCSHWIHETLSLKSAIIRFSKLLDVDPFLLTFSLVMPLILQAWSHEVLNNVVHLDLQRTKRPTILMLLHETFDNVDFHWMKCSTMSIFIGWNVRQCWSSSDEMLDNVDLHRMKCSTMLIFIGWNVWQCWSSSDEMLHYVDRHREDDGGVVLGRDGGEGLQVSEIKTQHGMRWEYND